MKILFLDFDGVLHPFNVRFSESLELALISEDKSLSLFCWAHLLESILDDEYPQGQIKIVLSTTWGHRYGLKEAAKRLTTGLQSRVVGGTIGYPQSRGRQIEQHVEDMSISIKDWIAIDDDDYLWPKHLSQKLVKTDDNLGLSEKSTQQYLRLKLKELLLS